MREPRTVNYTHAQRVTICCHNTDLVHVNGYDRIILVIFSQAPYNHIATNAYIFYGCLFWCVLKKFWYKPPVLFYLNVFLYCSSVVLLIVKGKGKSVPLQTWSGPQGSRKLRFPHFMTTAQDGGRVVSLTHRPPLPSGNTPGTHFCWRLSRPQSHSAIGRILCQWKVPMTPAGDRTSDLPICSTAP